MDSAQLHLDIESPRHYNHGLFSDYYLDELIPTDPNWLQTENEARTLRNELRALREKINPENLDEAQLEELWIKPVLQALGHFYSVQVKIRYRDTGYRKPDYILAHSQEHALELTSGIYAPPDLLGRALAVCDAKRWGINLDQSVGNGERNPSQQIDEYLRYSELPWGILTDGQYWRLYERESSKNNVYYAVDLFDLLTRDARDFMYFYVFFRREAFTSDWLQKTLLGSTEFAQHISDQLEDQVYEALELIAQGFLDYRRNNLDPSPDMLRTIYEQSLVFLYRLLFVLYAESRSILPMDISQAYREKQSLSHIKRQVIKKQEQGDLDPDHSIYYAQLKDLFFAIDRGNPRFSVPAYNGKLFSEKEYPFLAENAVGDAYLAPAIDKMARIPIQSKGSAKRPQLAFIDYRDLDVRHLGSIYEKLLEYHLDVATEPLALKSGKYVVAHEGDQIAKLSGQVYLRTGNFERKVTGSYYTPDYIVRFIVERTLEPLLSEITEQYAVRDDEEHWVVQDTKGLRSAILGLNILDPATGSGHFLVEVMSYIAEWLRTLAILEPNELPEGEDELAFWKRHVVNSCIYGIDINPLAVELAKLSLWLATLAQGKPLSFLNHHVKVGNALVGVALDQIGSEVVDPIQEKRTRTRQAKSEIIGQGILLKSGNFIPAITAAVQRMAEIENTMGSSLAAVKQQEEQYDNLTQAMEPWKQLANLWLARYFGQDIDQKIWESICKQVVDGHSIPSEHKSLFEQANQIARNFSFLHMQLEWPEVFFNADGTVKDNPGFNAIVGNPPYVRQEFIQPYKPYLELKYDVYQGAADLYVYFYEKGAEVLRGGGYLAYITANKWLKAAYGQPLREYLASSTNIRDLVDFGHAPIFKGADTFPIIVVLSKGRAAFSDDMRTHVTMFPREELKKTDVQNYVDNFSYSVSQQKFSADGWRLEQPDVEALMLKLKTVGMPLREFISADPLYGIKTGFNEAFLIDTRTKDRLVQDDSNLAEVIRPYLRGQDIKRWYPDWAGLWIILLKSSENYGWPWSTAKDNAEDLFSRTYPSLHKYFKQYEDNLRNRTDQGTYWWELRSCAYYGVFDSPKIPVQRIAFHSRFCIDREGMYINDAAIMLPTEDHWVLACLNSAPMWYYLFRSLPHKKDEALAMDINYVQHLPIAEPTDIQRAKVETSVTVLLQRSFERRQSVREVIDWLRTEFEIVSVSQKLEDFAMLDETSFINEVRKRRDSSSHLSPASLRALRETFNTYSSRIQAMEREILGLEQQITDMVNEAFSLTAEDIELMWRTAPPRMPIH